MADHKGNPAPIVPPPGGPQPSEPSPDGGQPPGDGTRRK